MASDRSYLLKPARVWSGGTTREGCSVLVRADRIVAVGADIDAHDAEVVDLARLTLLPGLMDLHNPRISNGQK